MTYPGCMLGAGFFICTLLPCSVGEKEEARKNSTALEYHLSFIFGTGVISFVSRGANAAKQYMPPQMESCRPACETVTSPRTRHALVSLRPEMNHWIRIFLLYYLYCIYWQALIVRVEAVLCILPLEASCFMLENNAVDGRFWATTRTPGKPSSTPTSFAFCCCGRSYFVRYHTCFQDGFYDRVALVAAFSPPLPGPTFAGRKTRVRTCSSRAETLCKTTGWRCRGSASEP